MASPPYDVPMEEESEHVSHSLGKDDVNHEHENFEFVNMKKFQSLFTCTFALKEQVKIMNANLTQVLTLL